jgi:nitroreductase
MDALDALHQRSSVPKLCGPLPSQEMLDNIYKAAFRAADHAVLRPWRFLVVKGDSRERLGELFAKAGLAKDATLDAAALEKLRRKPLRAPLVLVCVSSFKPHPKVPEIEQDLSAGAATQNMLLAAFAQGLGAMWRTGSLAYDPLVKNGLGLSEEEKIIGFLYIGTIDGGTKQLCEPDIQSNFQDW